MITTICIAGVVTFVVLSILEIRRGGEAQAKADIAEAKVTEITQTVKDAHEIETANSQLSDADLDAKLYNSINK